MSYSNQPQGPAKKEIIDAFEITHTQQDSNTVQKISYNKWIWVALSILLILAISVIFFLPSVVDESIVKKRLPELPHMQTEKKQAKPLKQKTEHVEENITTESVQALDAPQKQGKSQAEALLTKLIKLEMRLQDHGVQVWAAEDFIQGREQGRIGDEQLRVKQYTQAIESFASAIELMEDIEHRIQPTLEQAIMRGEQALSQGNEAAAMQQFELASVINPSDKRVKNGLKRTSTIKKLFVLLRQGSSYESHGQLQQALSVYKEAIVLDPLSTEAEFALARVGNKLRDAAYDQMIATAYQALQRGQYTDARTTFEGARKLKPDSHEITIGLNKVAQAARQEKISNLLFEANHFSELQKWQQAAQSYEKILELNEQHAQAALGKKQSLVKAKILLDLKTALGASNELYKDDVLNRAEMLLSQIDKLDSPGSIIQQRSKLLSEHVKNAKTPITVTLKSDNNTQVTVFRVARLGTFNQRQLQLRPGPYTIVGTRNGYRDVRVTIQVSPDQLNPVVNVRCEEAI